MQRAARPGCVARRISHLHASSTVWLIFVLSAILSLSITPAHAGGTVTNCTEAALRAVLAGGGTVTLACDGTIVLTNTVFVDVDTTMDGTGRNVVLSGGNAVRVFQVNPGVRLTLINLTVANGSHVGTNGAPGEPAFGGGILNSGGIVTLLGCLLTNNTAQAGSNALSFANPGGAARGGAVFNAGGSLLVTNSTFRQNWITGGRGSGPSFTQPGPSGDAFGGAIGSSNGVVHLVNSTFVSNSATGGVPGSGMPANFTYPGHGFGGAVYAEGGQTFVADCIFVGNQSAGASSPYLPPAYGYGGQGHGGALSLSNGMLACLRSAFVTNVARGGDGSNYGDSSDGLGGAMFIAGSAAFRDCTLSNNAAIGGRGGIENGLGLGGGIYSVGTLEISSSTLAGNAAVGPRSGGTAHGGVSGSGFGAGIFNTGILTVTNSTVFGNRAEGGEGSGFSIGAGAGSGGGLFNATGTVQIVNSTLSANVARNGGTNIGSFLPGRAGGIFSTNGTVTLRNSIVANSPSGSNCFGTLIDGGHNLSSDGSCNFTAPGSLNNIDPLLGPLGDYGGPTPTVSLLEGSPALNAADAPFCPPTDQRGFARPYGAGCDIGALESQSVVVTNCTEADLRAALAGGGTVTFACDGTITVTNTLSVVSDTTLDGTGRNVVLSGGNAVRVLQVNPGVRLTLINLTIANGRHIGTNGTNYAGAGGPGFGGGIYNQGGIVTLLNCVLTNNLARGGNGSVYGLAGPAKGGAIFNDGGVLLITNSMLRQNIAYGGSTAPGAPEGDLPPSGDGFGGAIFSHIGSVVMVGSRLNLNLSSSGAPVSPVPFVLSTWGSASGGAVHVFGGTIYSEKCYFAENVVTRSSADARFTLSTGVYIGGAISVSNASFSCWQTTFASNQVQLSKGFGGGGAVFDSGDTRLVDCVLVGNRAAGTTSSGVGADGRGGGVHSISNLTIVGCSVVGNVAVGGSSASGFQGPGSNVGADGLGGGIYSGGNLVLTNCTLFANEARGGDGFGTLGGISGLARGGAIFNAGSVRAAHVTLSGNATVNGAGATSTNSTLGGGIFSTNGTVTLWNSIVANSGAGSNCFGTLIDGAHNLSSDGSCNFTAPGSLNNTDPLLGPLGDYGGPTPTLALLEGSPALNAADAASCPPTDQRGFARPYGAGCDIGAFEWTPIFSIRGAIAGWAPHGLHVTAGAAATTVNPAGEYILNGLLAGTYSVRSWGGECVVVPPSRTVVLGPDAANVNFQSYRSNAFNLDRPSASMTRFVFAGAPSQSYQLLTSSSLPGWALAGQRVTDISGRFIIDTTNGVGAEVQLFQALKP